MANAREHLEHAEHAGHHGADPFDRRVAVTMAMIAAALAGISMAGHRKHNEVLRVEAIANRLRTEAVNATARESDKYAWYQSKKNRQTQYETESVVVGLLLSAAANGTGEKERAAAAKEAAKWRKKIEEYETDPKERLSNILDEAAAAGREAAALMAQADEQKELAEHAHHQADRLDVAHLLAEVGLVVCSLSMLTKRRSFWLTGLLAAVVALAVAGSAYAIPHHAPHPTAHPTPGHASPGHAAPDHAAPAKTGSRHP